MTSFIESALLKMSSENSTPKGGVKSESFEERLGSLVKQLDPKAATAEPGCSSSPVAQKNLGTVASLLLELTQVASELARVEMMLAQIMETVPEEEGAKRYHEISLQALQCSKKMMTEKQAQCLEDLGALIGSVMHDEESGITYHAIPASESAPPPTTWKDWSQEDIDAVPEFVPPSDISSKMLGSGSLRQDLELLRQRQPEHVIIVRRIKKLQFDSPTLLNQHFSQYGEVKELLVAHSHVKPTAKRPNGRVRPAALGFVVMADEEAAQKALQAGVNQMIHGVSVELAPFESFDDHNVDEDEQ